ncbi:MAG TPA: DMT family transporter [Candidatus Fraserbacteria bacterium]|nr:DMT family transporter [Candidatus Fraserbacteria bacterium]
MKPALWQLYLILSLAIGVISTAAILIVLAEAPPLAIAAYRMALASLLLLPWSWKTGGVKEAWRRLSRRDWGLSLLSGLFLALHFWAWVSSLKYTSVASAVMLVTTNPVFVGLGSHFLLRERLRRLMIWGIGLSVLGGLLIGAGDLRAGSGELLGDLLALAGALCSSAYFLIGRRVRQVTSLLSYITIVYGLAALILIGLALGTGTALWGYSPLTYGVLLALALGPQLIGHTGLNWALGYLSAPLIALFILGEPVGSTVLAYFVLGQGLSWFKLLGGVLIIAGIYLATRAP